MWFAVLLGCTRPADLQESPLEVTTGTDGTAVVEFSIDAADSVELTLRGESYVALDRLTGPDGVELSWEGRTDERQSSAIFSTLGEMVLVWPMKPGAWTAEILTTDLEDSPIGTDLTGRLLQKQHRGDTLDVTVRTSSGIEVPAASIERLEELYRAAGVRMNLTVEDTDLPSSAPTFESNDPVLAVVSEAPGVVIWLAGSLDQSFALGASGNTPGSTLPGTRALVMVSAEEMTGPDGEFSEEESRMLGEVFAHELGHFLGLFHPAEVSFDAFDALQDTPRCTTTSDCQEALDTNPMSPLPTSERLRFTRDQRALMRLHPAIY